MTGDKDTDGDTGGKVAAVSGCATSRRAAARAARAGRLAAALRANLVRRKEKDRAAEPEPAIEKASDAEREAGPAGRPVDGT